MGLDECGYVAIGPLRFRSFIDFYSIGGCYLRNL